MDRLHTLFGGTFDPVHNGHLAIARSAADALPAEVYLLPSAAPPHRRQPVAPAAERAELCRLAVAGEPHLHLDTRELRRGGTSYSIDTLHEVRLDVGARAPLAWLLGADAFAGLHRWHRWRELLELCHWVVARRRAPDAAGSPGPPGSTRPGDAAELAGLGTPLRELVASRLTADRSSLLTRPSGSVFLLDCGIHAESATLVRDRIARGQDWQDSVPGAVASRIRERKLYGAGPAPRAAVPRGL